MPTYVSEAELERRANWYTWPELFKLVQKASGADNDGCRQQILNAIRDGKLSLSWQDPGPGSWPTCPHEIAIRIAQAAPATVDRAGRWQGQEALFGRADTEHLWGVRPRAPEPPQRPDVIGAADADLASDAQPPAIGGAANHPGPKAGELSIKGQACASALQILKSHAERPRRGYGRLIGVARMVKKKLPGAGSYKDDSIGKMIRPTVRDWEVKNPHK
jgi:hypothetical protein